MAEHEALRKKPFTAELLSSSRRVTNELIGKVDALTSGALIGKIDEQIADHPKCIEILTPPKKKKKTTPTDVSMLRNFIYLLEQRHELPEEIDKEALDEAMRNKSVALNRREQRKTNQIGFATAATSLVIAGGVIAASIAASPHTRETQAQSEVGIHLTETPSLPSYSGWRIEGTSPYDAFVQSNQEVTIAAGESIVLGRGEEMVDTGIELHPSGKEIEIWVPTEDPYVPRPFGQELTPFRTPDKNLERDERTINDDQIVVLTGPNGEEHALEIGDATAPYGEHHRYTITHVTEVMPEV